GRVPLEFLSLNESDLARLVRSNCFQILNHFEDKRNEKRKHPWFLKEYELLTASDVQKRVTSAQALLTQGRFPEAHKIGVFMVISKNRKFPQLLLIAFVGVHLDAATVIILWIASVTIHAPCPTIISAHLQPVMHSVYQLVPLVLFLYLACSTDRRIRLRLLYLHARDVFSESGSITTTLTCFIVLTLLELIVSSHRLKICIPLSMNTSQGLHFTKCVSGLLLGLLCYMSFGWLSMFIRSRLELNANRRMSCITSLLVC
ncbi:hypothetical protein FBUS_10066, partial [Fasciolopsis buskii]